MTQSSSFFASLKTSKFLVLIALGVLVLYGAFAYDLVRSDLNKLISIFGALFFLTHQLIKHFGLNFWALAGLGLLFRLLFLPSIPNLSQDFYRFLWDGRLLLQGVNPYLLTPELFFTDLPAALEITYGATVPQAIELRDGMGSLNASHYSNYPPLNQLCFVIAALFAKNSILGSVIVLRTLIIIADLGILFYGKKLLEKLNLPVKNIFWYFLNPFIIIELTGNLHFEGVMLLFVVLSLLLLHKGKWFWAAIMLGLSVSVKLLPVLFLPLLFTYFRKHNNSAPNRLNFVKLLQFYVVVLATVVLTFTPFVSITFLQNFGETISLWFQTFEFNASVYYLIRWIGYKTVGYNIIATSGKILAIVVFLTIICIALFRKNNSTKALITSMLFAVSIYLLLSTTVHPWYLVTPLVLCLFTKYRFPILWSFMVILSYSAYEANGFDENLWLVALEYIVVIGYALYEIFIKRYPTSEIKKTEVI